MTRSNIVVVHGMNLPDVLLLSCIEADFLNANNVIRASGSSHNLRGRGFTKSLRKESIPFSSSSLPNFESSVYFI